MESIPEQGVKVPRGRRPTLNLKNSDMKEYRKTYYEQNKEKYTGQCICNICNAIYYKSNKSRHMKSNFHNEYLIKISQKINLLIN